MVVLLAIVSLAGSIPSSAAWNLSAPAPGAKTASTIEVLRLPEARAAITISLPAADALHVTAAKRANNLGAHKRLQVGIPREAYRFPESESAFLRWEAVIGGTAAQWQIVSPEAKALRIGLLVERMAPGIEIRFAGQDDISTVFGPFTASDLPAQPDTYWSPVLAGETATVEIFIPDGRTPADVEIAVTDVSHLFASPADPDLERMAKVGESGSCEIDVVCRTATNPALASVSKSVARMTFTETGSTYVCTGTLLNPLGGSFTPYFYTASHCIDTQAVAATLTTQWFFERSGCATGGTNPASVQLPGGATLLYANQGNDGALLRLNGTPPAGAVFAGWDAATLSAGTALTAIHHPSGDWKKVSLATMGGFQQLTNPTGSFVVANWNSGVTESGSSGSAIFSAVGSPATEYRLRGGLYGGLSACGAPPQNMVDFYSRFDLVYPSIAQYLNPPVTNFTLAVSKSGSGSGAVNSTPAGVACGSTCSSAFSAGTLVALSATPSAGSTFAGWSGACSGTGGCQVTMNAAKSVGAAFDVVVSQAAVSGLVTSYYNSILGRAPDASGLDFWTGEANRVIALGADVREVFFAMSIDFFKSQEYANRARNDDQHLTDLYRTFFLRDPDPAGKAYWQNHLDQGMDRGSLLVNFLFSTEFSNFMSFTFGAASPRPEINMTIDLYRGVLNRLPDTGGFNFWLGRVRAAQCQGASAVSAEVANLALQFFYSAEYANIEAARAPAQRVPRYVGDLYNAFLRRGPELAGYQYWIGQINSGARTRDDVRNNFVGSAEFQARVGSVIAAGCYTGP